MLLISIYGGPGTGKSTTAAGVFHRLKTMGVNSEYIQEYAKDLTWEERYNMLALQPYVAANQLRRQVRLQEKVTCAITDGALLNSLVYKDSYIDDDFEKWLIATHRRFNNLNIFLERNVEFHGYEEAGRNQNLDQAITFDVKALAMLHRIEEPFEHVPVGDRAVEDIVKLACIRLGIDYENSR